MKRQAALVVALLAVGLAVPAFAGAPLGAPGWVPGPDTSGEAFSADAPPPAPKWGGSSWTTTNVAGIGFTPLNDGQWSHTFDGWSRKTAGGNTGHCVDVHMPSGALLQWVTTHTNDTDAGGTITIELYSYAMSSSVGTTIFSFSTTGTPGVEHAHRAVTPAVTINNLSNSYALCTFHTVIGTTLESGGNTLWYTLQVSPAPATATFTDVPTSHGQFRFVEALVASGVTGGCGGGNFCPTTPVTRGQFAVFLATALGMHFPN